MLSSDVVLKLKKHIVIEYFDEGALVLNLNNRAITEFDTRESWLLKQINGQRSLQQVVEKFADQFSLTPDQGLEKSIKICFNFWSKYLLYAVKGKLKGVFMDNTYYIQNPDVNIREEDEDGALLFNPDTDQVQLVSRTGFYIWKLCAGEHTVTEIVNAFKEDYEEVPEQEVVSDVEEFINKMVETGFLGMVDKS